MNFRRHMQKARLRLHEHMAMQAYYLDSTGGGEPLLITVRPHEKFAALGDMKGTNLNYAELSEIDARMVFLLSEVEPVRGNIVSIAKNFSFRIDTVFDPDPPTVTATVSFLGTDSRWGDLPFPVENEDEELSHLC